MSLNSPPDPDDFDIWDEFATRAVAYRKAERVALIGATVAVVSATFVCVSVATVLVIAFARWLL